MSLGARVKQLRLAQSLTQDELAQLINSSKRQIWKYEANQNEPTSGVIVNLARALNTTSDYILGLTDNPDQCINTISDLTYKEREMLKALRSGNLEAVLKIYMAQE